MDLQMPEFQSRILAMTAGAYSAANADVPAVFRWTRAHADAAQSAWQDPACHESETPSPTGMLKIREIINREAMRGPIQIALDTGFKLRRRALAARRATAATAWH